MTIRAWGGDFAPLEPFFPYISRAEVITVPAVQLVIVAGDVRSRVQAGDIVEEDLRLLRECVPRVLGHQYLEYRPMPEDQGPPSWTGWSMGTPSARRGWYLIAVGQVLPCASGRVTAIWVPNRWVEQVPLASAWLLFAARHLHPPARHWSPRNPLTAAVQGHHIYDLGEAGPLGAPYATAHPLLEQAAHYSGMRPLPPQFWQYLMGRVLARQRAAVPPSLEWRHVQAWGRYEAAAITQQATRWAPLTVGDHLAGAVWDCLLGAERSAWRWTTSAEAAGRRGTPYAGGRWDLAIVPPWHPRAAQTLTSEGSPFTLWRPPHMDSWPGGLIARALDRCGLRDLSFPSCGAADWTWAPLHLLRLSLTPEGYPRPHLTAMGLLQNLLQAHGARWVPQFRAAHWMLWPDRVPPALEPLPELFPPPTLTPSMEAP